MTKGIKVLQQASHAGYVRRLIIEVDCNDISAKGMSLAIHNAAKAGAKELTAAVRRQKGVEDDE